MKEGRYGEREKGSQGTRTTRTGTDTPRILFPDSLQHIGRRGEKSETSVTCSPARGVAGSGGWKSYHTHSTYVWA